MTFSAVEKPGSKISALISSADGDGTRRDQAALDRRRLDPLGVEPLPVVGDLDDDVPALVIGAQRQSRLRRLPAAARTSAVSMPWSTLLRTMCISGIGDLLDDLAIELGVLAGEHELDGLARLAAQVAHDARHLLEGLADRHHAQRHRAALQIGGDALQLGQVAGEPLIDDALASSGSS